MKTTNTFGVQFIIRTEKNDPLKALIYARITVNGKRIEVSLKRTIDPLTWHYPGECLRSTSVEAKQINKFIEETRYKLRECYQQLQMQSKLITAEAIKNLFLGEEKSKNTLCSLIDYHNVNMKSVLAQGTLKNYFTTKKYVLLFLKKRYKTNDIYLSDLNYQFITEFDFFLRSTKPLDESNPLGHNGIMKHIERLKKIARLGANNGKHSSIHLYLDRDNSGMKITKEALLISNKYIDESYKYKNHKDLNEFLMKECKIETPRQRIGRRL